MDRELSMLPCGQVGVDTAELRLVIYVYMMRALAAGRRRSISVGRTGLSAKFWAFFAGSDSACVSPTGSFHRRPEPCLPDAVHAVEVEVGEVEAGEDVVVGRGEGAVVDPRGEVPLCPVPSRVEEPGQGELGVTTGAGGVVGTGVELGMSLM